MSGEPGTFIDASPLIALAKIDSLDLLRVLPQPILVTEVVWAEVAGELARPGAIEVVRAEQRGAVRRVSAGDTGAYPRLGPGENSVLSAAAEVGAWVLIDDIDAHKLVAANAALRTSISTIFTTTSFLIYAKRQGVIAAVKPVLDALIQQEFGIAADVYAEALRLARETPD